MYLVTGGSGFLGQHLTERCLLDGHSVRILDIVPPSRFSDHVEYLNNDVRDLDAVRHACSGVDVVIHNAALVPLSKSGDLFWEVNVRGTQNLLQAAREAGVKKFIFISSSSVFGIPKKPEAITEQSPMAAFEKYGKSKVAAEALCQQAKRFMDISIIRPRTILGPGRMGLMSLIFDWVATNHNVYILGRGENIYQLVSVEDIVDAIARAASMPCKGEDFNIGTDKFETLRQDLETFIRGVGGKSRVVSVPGWLARLTLPALSLLRLSPFVSYQYHIADHSVFFSVEKARRILGFEPKHSNSEMLINAFNWYIRNKDNLQQMGSIHQKKVSAGIFKLLKYIP
ncbi:MAG: NAD-dependent epimerase/dehydratase family protein [bacterium]